MDVQDYVYKLNTGREFPMVGFGTYKIKGKNLIYSVIDAALKAGYKSIDTAAVYGNEEDIGLALKDLLPKYNLKREDIFITTKLAPSDFGRERAVKAVEKSLKNLGVDYIDLYLIHWPGVSSVPVDSSVHRKERFETWETLTNLYNTGCLRAIGVSNYTVRHLAELLDKDNIVKPAVNQVELHPYFRQEQLRTACEKAGILVQAYCSLGGSAGANHLLNDSTVVEVAQRLGRTPAQVLLRWALQLNAAVIPKSVNPDRIASNIALNFELLPKDMELLNSLKTVKKFAWDPEIVA
ncbi:uncharacterized oxidoreductase MSMEG_2408/MSMEI_2347-like [Schistocerca piceifrons]|uniref:uncharacterized oxidoreductase MSMEG_2408/MSMEI_2347-like n=1 Tax=Schistocerca piceifrons TaxID=274613 RepID=UPI001F5ED69C|nr:uncharacterized oxidoreductase MSMEG_2408/MSMEI_2347-like [Schistocerca piceifrons]XP_049959405.1 uncharacterized oxidoreductase MSMEG_2408/MSMEI_2347-like isoform X1 [Schistocerca serialis cubense]